MAGSIPQVFWMAGMCTACDCGRTMRGRGPSDRAGCEGGEKGEESDVRQRTHPRTHIPYLILYDTT